ncbi:cathelicidin-2-like [Varanus komodoensis]|uniref:Vipericidin n=1 Tax=Varanus komodoensis TaxID=61221 RepID=A0A8D2Q3U2_VARKO|nr:cathelicidin-2-like [Varanus komodoensis]
MELFLLGVTLLMLGVPGATSPPLDAPSALLPRDVARMAVEDFNQEAEGQAVFRLLKLKHTHKVKFRWGFHFSLNFTIKETHCRKSDNYRIENCRYKTKGPIQDCSAQVSVLNFMPDSPLTSVKCRPLQRGNGRGSRKAQPSAMLQAEERQPQVHVEVYLPSAYSIAALSVAEEEPSRPAARPH